MTGVSKEKILFFFQMFVMQSAPHMHCDSIIIPPLVCVCMRVHEGVCVRMCVWMCMCALEPVCSEMFVCGCRVDLDV